MTNVSNKQLIIITDQSRRYWLLYMIVNVKVALDKFRGKCVDTNQILENLVRTGSMAKMPNAFI